jgi:hypothetical protein
MAIAVRRNNVHDAAPIRSALSYFDLGEPIADTLVGLRLWLARARVKARSKFRNVAKRTHPDGGGGDKLAYRELIRHWTVLKCMLTTDDESLGVSLKLVDSGRTYLLPISKE